MKLGIGLPSTLVPTVNRGLMLDWARQADQAGFHVLGTIDQPGYDSWEPLTTLAIAAGVTERARLATTILQLPNRNEVMVAKQAAVIDRVSGGRLDLGIAVGGRESDFKPFGARLAGRGKKMDRQIRKIRRTWRAARRAPEDEGGIGPAPLQKPLPPIIVGGMAEPAIKRATEAGDGFIFGTAGPQMMGQYTPNIRRMAEAAGRKNFQVWGLAYYALGPNPETALEEGQGSVLRYYHGQLWKPPAELIHHGPVEVIADAVREYEQSGIDVLVLCPTIPSLKQVEELGEKVLPAYRIPGK